MLHRNPSFVRWRFSAVVRLPALAPRYRKSWCLTTQETEKERWDGTGTRHRSSRVLFLRDICSHVSIIIIFAFAWISHHSLLPPLFLGIRKISLCQQDDDVSFTFQKKCKIPQKRARSRAVEGRRGVGAGLRFSRFFSRNRNETLLILTCVTF